MDKKAQVRPKVSRQNADKSYVSWEGNDMENRDETKITLEEIEQHLTTLERQMDSAYIKEDYLHEFNQILTRTEYLVKLRSLIFFDEINLKMR